MTKPSSARMTYRPDSRGKLIREATQLKPQPPRQPQSQSQEQPKPSVLKEADSSRWKTEVPESLSSLAFTTEYKNWNSPFQQNIEAVESPTPEQEDPLRKTKRHRELDYTYNDIDSYVHDDLDVYHDSNVNHDTDSHDGTPAYDNKIAHAYAHAGHSVLGDPLDQLFTGPIIDMEYKGQRNDMEFTGPIIDMGESLYERKLNIPSVRPIKSGVRQGAQRRGPSWTMVLLSVAGAVATGALFGYIALTLFAGESVLPAGSFKSSQPSTASTNAPGGKASAGKNGSTVTGTGSATGNANTGTGTGSATSNESSGTGSAAGSGTGSSSGTGSNTGTGTGSSTGAGATTSSSTSSGSQTGASGAAGGNTADAADVKAGWAARSFSLLQYGVFSAKESADAAELKLRDAGLAASSAQVDGTYRVYAGAAPDRSGAESLAALQGTDVYIKPISLPAVGKIRYTGDASQLKAFDGLTASLIGYLSDLTQIQLAQDKPAAESESRRTAWTKQLEKWQGAAAAVKQGLQNKDAQAAAAALETAAAKASKALSAYSASPSKKGLWAVQSGMMDLLLAQRELRGSLQP